MEQSTKYTKQILDFVNTKKTFSKHFISLGEVFKNKNENIDFYIIGALKGCGKTMGALKNVFIEFQKSFREHLKDNKNPLKTAVWVRNQQNQIKNFSSPFNINKYFTDLNIFFPKSTKFTHKSIKLNLYKNAKLKDGDGVNGWPFLSFVSLTDINSIQSIKDLDTSIIIFDEIQSHFKKNESVETFNRCLNLISSLLRNKSAKILIIFNLIDANTNIFLSCFNIIDDFVKLKQGKSKIVQRTKHINGKPYRIKLKLLKPTPSKEWFKEHKESIAVRSSKFTNYGQTAISSYNFYIEPKDIKYIKKYGCFKHCIKFESYIFGVWIKIKDGVELWQLSNKYNKNYKKSYCFLLKDFDNASFLGSSNFLLNLRLKLVNHLIEFENYEIYQKIISLIHHNLKLDKKIINNT